MMTKVLKKTSEAVIVILPMQRKFFYVFYYYILANCPELILISNGNLVDMILNWVTYKDSSPKECLHLNWINVI